MNRIRANRRSGLHAMLCFGIALLFANVAQAAEIHDAARAGDLNRVKEILAQHPGWLNLPDEFDRSPLVVALSSRQEAVVIHLLECGADVNRPDREGFAPLQFAVLAGKDEWAGLLLGRGAEVDDRRNVLGSTPLHVAARFGQTGCASLLLKKGARPDMRDKAGMTPLLLAVANGQAETAGALLAAGASIAERDAMGNNVLHLAALAGQEPLAGLLLEKGVPLNVANRYGGTPFDIAVREGHDAIARILKNARGEPAPHRHPEPQGAYLGQPRPGETPVLFAPGVVSTEKRELNSVFSPDGREFYFTIHMPTGAWRIMVMKREGMSWTKPQVAPFSGTHSDVDLFIAPDGRKLYFCSNRPRGDPGGVQKNFDIWVVERRGDGWSEASNPGAPLNSDQDEFYPSLTRDGTIYFQSRRPESGPGAHIFRARLEDGAYRRVEKLGPAINCEPFVGDTLVAPDEGWVVFSVNRPGGFGQGDLHVSFRGAGGDWSGPLNLGGEINTPANENCAILSPDGQYLFYTSAGDIYWVSASVIKGLRPKE